MDKMCEKTSWSYSISRQTIMILSLETADVSELKQQQLRTTNKNHMTIQQYNNNNERT
jgi:hypothetical protein